MICDTLDQLHLYKGFHKNLDTAIEFLAAHPLDTLPLGRTEVDGDEVFINVMDADLKPHTGSRAEYQYSSHEKSRMFFNICPLLKAIGDGSSESSI